MSLINFLNPKLKPSVECDCVCEDGHAVANLIADDVEQLQRGFMAFFVTKPPIEVVFDFPKAIDLKVIKLWNSLGALRSTSFEVHGKYEGIWERVGYVRELSKNIDSVTFCYQSDYSSRSELQQHSEKVFFFKTAHKILAHTTSLKIIIRATQKCAPVLKKVQIWGLPARSLDKADRELVRTIWNEVTFEQGYNAAEQEQAGQRSPCRPELNDNANLCIPEEFLDAITWEIMIFPTVLPSGKIVDQSTIDRHSEVESKWGRTPSDPFTGLEFTSYRKAILDLPLKSRIEKFLMENSDHFKSIPRSLGSCRLRRSRNRHASQFASLHQHSTAIGTYSSLLSNVYQKPSATKKTSATATLCSTLPAAKRARLSSATETASSLDININLTTTTTATQTSGTATLSTSLSSSSSIGNSNSAAASSIDVAIQQALSKITRFTRPAAETKPACCQRCHSLQFTYEIQTCKHLLCRECLVLLQTQDQMCSCNTSFKGSDVQRLHRL